MTYLLMFLSLGFEWTLVSVSWRQNYGVYLMGDDQISLRRMRQFCRDKGGKLVIERRRYDILALTDEKTGNSLSKLIGSDLDLEANCLPVEDAPVYSRFFSLSATGLRFRVDQERALVAWLSDQEVLPFWRGSPLYAGYVERFGQPQAYAISVRCFPTAKRKSKLALDLFMFFGYHDDTRVRALRFQRLDASVIVGSEIDVWPRGYNP